MFFRRSERKPTPVERLRQLIRTHLPDADEDTHEIVFALAGLLACVAYADREFDAAEQLRACEALNNIPGLTAGGVAAICAALREHVGEIASVNPQAYTRALRERTQIEVRREVLDVLVDLGAADGTLSLAETDLLRRTTSALGLSPDEYLVSQARHRDKLGLLR
ncbi:MAG TPA: TerB family tellurite resistance protein [Polyangiales bacterium]|jgi:uncharacterized tellurite resistance protein B-like protein